MKELELTAENAAFPLRLRELMAEHGTKQEQLAQHLGIRRQTLSLYVNGQSRADWTQVVKIAQYYNVPADWLLGLSDVKSQNVTAKAVERLTGLSEQALASLTSEKQNTSYIRGLNFLIEEKTMLQRLICYMWSDFYSHLSRGEFQYIPKRQDVLDYMDDIQFASVVQNLADFKSRTFEAHKDSNAVVDAVLWESLKEFADLAKCRQILEDNTAHMERITADESYELAQEATDLEDEAEEETLTPEEVEAREAAEAQQLEQARQFMMVSELFDRFPALGEDANGE